jgi:hypothetical protein
VSVPLFALVIPVHHKVRQIGDQTPSEPTGSVGKVDELPVLGPLGLGGQDGFPEISWSIGKDVGRERDRLDEGMFVKLDVCR